MSKTLVSSGLIAAMATALPATIAAAGTTVQTDEATFVAAASGAGFALDYTEDFSSYAIAGPYDIYPSPWTSTVAPDLSITDPFGGLQILYKGAYWYGSIPTNAMGSLTSDSPTLVSFAGGVNAVGMDVYGIGTFIANPFDEISYTVFDTGGGFLTSGSYVADGNVGGYFGVVSDTGLIGSIEFQGLSFGLGSGEFVSNVQAWAVPAPGALAILGLGGAFAARRRR